MNGTEIVVARIELINLNKSFGAVQAVKNVSFTIEDGEFVVFVGPSGCGKTTTLRMIAGFEDPTSGEIRIDGRVVNDLEPRDRNLGMVFQSHALFPQKCRAEHRVRLAHEEGRAGGAQSAYARSPTWSVSAICWTRCRHNARAGSLSASRWREPW